MSGKINSPLGQTSYSSGRKVMEYEIPDFDNPMEAYESHAASEMQEKARIAREIQEAKELKRMGRERLTDSAKKRIEMLIGMSKLYREIEVEDNKYVLQTLSSKDLRDVYAEAIKFDNTVEFPYELRRQILARSLTHVAGQDINQFLSSNDLNSRLEFLDMLPESLISRILDEYNALSKESNEKFSIKTDADVKELVSDLKK